MSEQDVGDNWELFDDSQAQRDEHLTAYEQYAAEEARGYEQIFWEQVFLEAYRQCGSFDMDWPAQAAAAAMAADNACEQRAKRLT